MLAVERRNEIEKLINEKKSVLVPELAKLFDVTTETIRGDLLNKNIRRSYSRGKQRNGAWSGGARHGQF
jgi:DeoR/GlpR family transcriptional regulator of sugar metabolism